MISAALILNELPQTQCTRCGYPDCAAYAQAIFSGEATINRCPPGGQEGIDRLAKLIGQTTALGLDPDHGIEGPRYLAWIDETWCIGCTLCIEACPADAIVGTHKWMHTVIENECTGCELCIPVCPVDCIQLENATLHLTAWAAWSKEQAQRAQSRYEQKIYRLQKNKTNPLPPNQDDKSSRLEIVLARVQQNLESKPLP